MSLPIEVVPAHDGNSSSLFLWIDPAEMCGNDDRAQVGPFTVDQAQRLIYALEVAIVDAEDMGRRRADRFAD